MEVVEAIDPKVSVEMNQSLVKQFTRDEIEATLKQMHPTKSLGPDGMLAIFYQKYWDIVDNDVVSMVLNVLNSNMLGSKDLGFYVFRTLMCIVGKP